MILSELMCFIIEDENLWSGKMILLMKCNPYCRVSCQRTTGGISNRGLKRYLCLHKMTLITSCFKQRKTLLQ